VSGERVSAFYDPIDVIGDVREKCRSVAAFEALEQATHFLR
jgi:hypothetical protein